MLKPISLLACCLVLGFMVMAVSNPALAETEKEDSYYTVVDRDTGQIIFRTGMAVTPGDKYLTGNNLLYRVERISGFEAYAQYLGREDLRASAPPVPGFWARLTGSLASFFHLSKGGGKAGPVAIYHTHSDESYVPTDGTYTKPGKGGVYQVGKALANRLSSENQNVIHSYASHDPHDGMAYERSRRTAADLLRRNPAALIDLHRDAAPRQEYADQIDNQGVTKVQIVLGRSNPNLKANEAFAKQIKAVVDRKYPGFIKGIFYGDGKFNQDLSPRAILLEFGAQTNARQSAERGAAIFAAAARSIIAAPGSRVSQTGGAIRSILYVLGGVLLVGLFFLLINAGSLGQAGRNLGKFFRHEFTSALGDKERKRHKPEAPDSEENER